MGYAPQRDAVGRLMVQTGSLKGQHFFLSRQCPRVFIGRDPSCGIVFHSQRDPFVSRRHACVEVSGQDVYLTDLKSLTGTLVDGCPIAGRIQLRTGMRIQLGAGGPLLLVLLAAQSEEVQRTEVLKVETQTHGVPRTEVLQVPSKSMANLPMPVGSPRTVQLSAPEPRSAQDESATLILPAPRKARGHLDSPADVPAPTNVRGPILGAQGSEISFLAGSANVQGVPFNVAPPENVERALPNPGNTPDVRGLDPGGSSQFQGGSPIEWSENKGVGGKLASFHALRVGKKSLAQPLGEKCAGPPETQSAGWSAVQLSRSDGHLNSPETENDWSTSEFQWMEQQALPEGPLIELQEVDDRQPRPPTSQFCEPRVNGDQNPLNKPEPLSRGGDAPDSRVGGELAPLQPGLGRQLKGQILVAMCVTTVSCVSGVLFAGFFQPH